MILTSGHPDSQRVEDVKVGTRPETQAHPSGAVQRSAAEDQSVPIGRPPGCDFASHENFSVGATVVRRPAFQQRDAQDCCPLQRNGGSRSNAMHVFGVDPLFESHDREAGIFGADPQLCSPVHHAHHEFLCHVVCAGASVEHALDLTVEHLDYRPVLVASWLVVRVLLHRGASCGS